MSSQRSQQNASSPQTSRMGPKQQRSISSSTAHQPTPHPSPSRARKILLLHGSRQTGQLLLGRMDKLRKKLQKKFGMTIVAPDAPFAHPDDADMRSWWWHRSSCNDEITMNDPNHYEGLEQSMQYLSRLWNQDSSLEGVIGFSQGARMAHLMAVAATVHCESSFDNLKFVIFISGYDAPLPSNWPYPSPSEAPLVIPSLHVWGQEDALITPEQSRAVLKHYQNPLTHIHSGGHHVPMRAASVDAYLHFIETATNRIKSHKDEAVSLDGQGATAVNSAEIPSRQPEKVEPPDEEEAQAQQDEVEALSAIFPDEFTMLSPCTENEDGTMSYEHPIAYLIALPASEEGTWPPHPLTLHATYPPNYPSQVGPTLSFQHNNNVMELSSAQMEACTLAMQEAAEAEQGMPCVLSCVYAAREFFESGGMASVAAMETKLDAETDVEEGDEDSFSNTRSPDGATIARASLERIQECNREGLQIATYILESSASDRTQPISNGGSWKYTIGLVGKPSAGKSTFFNAATAFARQRNDAENAMGGATMAPHPFTTIDPNVGYCLVPAPEGSCPEEELADRHVVGSTHGRDSSGRRLLPVMLKDVAGLVPGAYQGRGRGNKFLNDLTDADVLIHVVDASGTADTEGNTVVGTCETDGGSHPLNDLAWIHNELIEWVYTNLMFKWDSICRRGRNKLSGMFSGYGQNQATVWDVLLSVEKYMDRTEQRDHALDNLASWDQGDVHRLVSAFLGVRFPMALALNKKDLPPAVGNISDVQEALPTHGAHVGVPLSARSEMQYVRLHLEHPSSSDTAGTKPEGVWQCLQSAMMLRAPVLVFPVSDMATYAPLPGMQQAATLDASLPNAGMVACLQSAGGSPPSLWKDGGYTLTPQQTAQSPLRDVLLLKPGSTVEDAFEVLKRQGALAGEFVRAEGASSMGDKPKMIPKHQIINRSCRILKIMTSKRSEWQTKI